MSSAVVVYNGKLWIFGGCKIPGMVGMNDVWCSEDGINWTCMTDSAPWSERWYHESMVFEDKMWIHGGITTGQIPVNDSWYSEDGVNWVCAAEHNPWNQRHAHRTAVFEDKMWLMGGYAVNSYYQNDVWCSASTGIEREEGASESICMLSVSPNPMRHSSTITLSLLEGGETSIVLFDHAGRRLNAVFSGYLQSGQHSFNIFSVNSSGYSLPTGIYLLRVAVDSESFVRTIINLD